MDNKCEYCGGGGLDEDHRDCEGFYWGHKMHPDNDEHYSYRKYISLDQGGRLLEHAVGRVLSYGYSEDEILKFRDLPMTFAEEKRPYNIYTIIIQTTDGKKHKERLR